MASGVGVSDQCKQVYQELKLGKKHKYIIFNLNKTNTEIIVEKFSSSEDYDDFVNDLPETEPRWAVYDFAFESDGGKRNKLTFVSWAPDDAKIKAKMLAASSKDSLRRSLDGIALEVQATDPSEIAYEAVLDKASKGTR